MEHDAQLTELDLNAIADLDDNRNGHDALPTQTGSFDYSGVDDAAAKQARAAVSRIRELLQTSIIGTGKDLLAVKKALGHGKFGEWLRFHFKMTERTAENFMSAAREFESFPKILDVLPATTVYKLASRSTPEEVRQSVVKAIKSGNTPGAKDVEYLITNAKAKCKLQNEMDREWFKTSKALRKEGKSEQEIRDERASWEKRYLAEREDHVSTHSAKTINDRNAEIARLIKKRLGSAFSKHKKGLMKMIKPEYRDLFEDITEPSPSEELTAAV